jgi:hypothetical protein
MLLKPEFSVSELASNIDIELQNLVVNGHLVLDRVKTLSSLYKEKEWQYKRRKRKRLGEEVANEDEPHPDLINLATKLEGSSLSCLK